MTQFLVFPAYDAEPDLMLITNAATPEIAKCDYALKVGIRQKWFKDDVYTRSINMSFSERFFLQTDEECREFSERGTVSVDESEFERRVRRFFSAVPHWARLYLLLWNDRTTPHDMLPERHPLPDDMLIFMYLNYDSKDDGLCVVPTQELKRR